MSKSWQTAVAGEDWAVTAFKAAALVGMPNGSQFLAGVNQFLSGDLSIGSALADAIGNAAKTGPAMYQSVMGNMVSSIHNLIDGVLTGQVDTPPPPARSASAPPLAPSFFASVPTYAWLGVAAAAALLLFRRK